MNNNIKILLDKARDLEWAVNVDEEDITFGKFSSAGQDFSFSIDYTDDMGELLKSIYDSYEDFDVSTEAYLWLDEFGHGINGAPYDMKDVYEDMEECENSIYNLHSELLDLSNDIEDMEE